jgi:hypothetical protein
VRPLRIREYVGRDWAALEATKRGHWAGVYQREGWRRVWEAAQALWLHARLIHPGFPDERDRDADLAHHLAFRSQLDGAADAFSRR